MPDSSTGLIKAVWSPPTRSLKDEVPGLFGVLLDQGFDLLRLVYNPADWSPAPTRVSVDGRVIRLASMLSQDPGTVLVTDWHGKQARTIHVAHSQPRGLDAREGTG